MSGGLLDTSVWQRYFAGRAGAHNERVLGDLLDSHEVVLSHPAVIGELVLGGLSNREVTLLTALPVANEASNDDVLALIRARRLFRRGIGWVDCHLLASAWLARASLWSFDRPLCAAATALEVAFEPA